jgi:hypothetical protein
MAKFKPVKAKKKTPPARGAVPCIILLIGGMALLTLLFWAILRSS